MSLAATKWLDLAPQRGALARLARGDREVWASRLRYDRERAARHQSPALAKITRALQEQAKDAGALAFVLSGSTARGRRTQISDLDYHVIGVSSLEVANLPGDIDLFTDDANRFQAKLHQGDDLTHWSVWYGCVLFDSGVMREAAEYVAEHDAWPDPQRKLRQAREALDFAVQMAASGDYAATLEMVRGALTLTARWVLLSHDVFPLARAELPDQLEQLGQKKLALALRQAIHGRPDFEMLEDALIFARSLCREADQTARRVA
jgi:predicted nucleotidyltransferase